MNPNVNAIATEPLIYHDPSGNAYEGTISWDTARSGSRPVVMVTPTFRGQSDFETHKAQQLAELGYIGFAIDIYGQGIRASTPEEAGQLMATLNHNRPLLLARMQLAADTARTLPQADPRRIAAIGFCFGGKCVLDLARSGADIAAIVSFHGIYDPPGYPTADQIPAAVLVLHGWEDPLSPPEPTVALARELTQAGADWQIHMYSHTAHAFTNPQASDRTAGMVYNPLTTQRAWQTTTAFLTEKLAF